eukprot:1161907-Pelagomonas_calceolata.AAC.11
MDGRMCSSSCTAYNQDASVADVLWSWVSSLELGLELGPQQVLVLIFNQRLTSFDLIHHLIRSESLVTGRGQCPEWRSISYRAFACNMGSARDVVSVSDVGFPVLWALPVTWAFPAVWAQSLTWAFSVMWALSVIRILPVIWSLSMLWALSVIWAFSVMWALFVLWSFPAMWGPSVIWASSVMGALPVIWAPSVIWAWVCDGGSACGMGCLKLHFRSTQQKHECMSRRGWHERDRLAECVPYAHPVLDAIQ